MSNQRDILDMTDPYEAHAYFMLCFTCDDCPTDLSPDEVFEDCDDLYCRHLSNKAKAAGWYLPPALPGGGSDVMTAYCPACARKRGLREESQVED